MPTRPDARARNTPWGATVSQAGAAPTNDAGVEASAIRSGAAAHARGRSSRVWRWAIVASIAAPIIVAATMGVWWLAGQRVWTDGLGFEQPSSDAQARQVVWSSPWSIAQPINTEADDYQPTLSADGGVMLLVRGRPGDNADIYTANREGQGWSTPTPLDAINSEADELSPMLSHDGRWLVFSSNREGGQGQFDLWISRRTDDGWSTPVNLAGVNSPFNEYDPSLSPDASRLYFASDRAAHAHEATGRPWQATVLARPHADLDLYMASITAGTGGESEAGTPLTIESIEPLSTLNTAAGEGACAVAPHGDFLYFTSNREGGVGGFDIYRARLDAQGMPGRIEHLDRGVNTPADEIDPRPILGGFSLLLSSNRGNPDVFDVYQAESREVFQRRDAVRTPTIAWSWWLLLIALLALIPMLFLLRHADNPAVTIARRATVLSIIAHLLLTVLFSVIMITHNIYVSQGEGDGLEIPVDLSVADEMQVRLQAQAQLTKLPVPPPQVSAAAPQVETWRPPAIERPVDRALPDVRQPREVWSTSPQPPTPQPPTPEDAPQPAASPLDALESPQPQVMVAQLQLQEVAPVRTAEAAVDPSVEEAAQSADRIEAVVQFAERAVVQTRAPSTEAVVESSMQIDLPAADAPATVESGMLLPTFTELPDLAMQTPELPSVQVRRDEAVMTPPTSADPSETARVARTPMLQPRERSDMSSQSAPSIKPTVEADSPPLAMQADALAPSELEIAVEQMPIEIAVEAQRVVEVASALPLPQMQSAQPIERQLTVQPVDVDQQTVRREVERLSTARSERPSSSPPPLVDLAGEGPEQAMLPVVANDSAAPQLDIEQPQMTLALETDILGPVSLSTPPAMLHRRGERRARLVEELGGTDQTEQAVERALAFLARHQADDGRWTKFDDPRDRNRTDRHDQAITGLSVLCFLAAGHTPDTDGQYRQVVARGLDALLNAQHEDGDLRGESRFRGGGADDANMYDHAIATLTLAEAAAMTGDARYREAALRGAAFIVAAQHGKTGGWRYAPGAPRGGGDTSVLGWQAMALHSAEAIGFEIPGGIRAGAFRWLDRVGAGRHGVLAGYDNNKPTTTMTAEGVFSRIALKQRLSAAQINEAAEYIMRDRPDPRKGQPDYYKWYYASLAILHSGSDHWPQWNAAVQTRLLHEQRRNGALDGSWDPRPSKWGSRGGVIYSTAMATLTLEVYYRYLPMSQRRINLAAQTE